MKKKVVPKLRQEVKVKVYIITSDDIKIYYTGKLQDFTARYIIKHIIASKAIKNIGSATYTDSQNRIFNRVISVISVVLREITLTISDSTGEPVSIESEIVRVVSLSIRKYPR